MNGWQKQKEWFKRSPLENIARNPGDNVIIPVSVRDRCKGDPRSLMVVILDRSEHDLY